MLESIPPTFAFSLELSLTAQCFNSQTTAAVLSWHWVLVWWAIIRVKLACNLCWCFFAQLQYAHVITVWWTHNSYLTVIGVHEMHGRIHPNYCQITILLVVDLCSSLAYFMTHPLPIVNKLPIQTLVARQLPTNRHIATYKHIHIGTFVLYKWFMWGSPQLTCLMMSPS